VTHNPFNDQTNTEQTIGFFTRKECVEMNLDFARAMLSARKRGEEHFTIGCLRESSGNPKPTKQEVFGL
jgi:hypothetical protein